MNVTLLARLPEHVLFQPKFGCLLKHIEVMCYDEGSLGCRVYVQQCTQLPEKDFCQLTLTIVYCTDDR